MVTERSGPVSVVRWTLLHDDTGTGGDVAVVGWECWCCLERVADRVKGAVVLWQCVGECGDRVTLVSFLAWAVATIGVGDFRGAAGRTVDIRVTRQQFQQLMDLRDTERQRYRWM